MDPTSRSKELSEVMDRDIGEAKQLVAFDLSGSIAINEDVLRSCFLAEDVKDRPLCLISIIGEERKGKSFLLNYLLRRLSQLELKDQQWLGAEDEDLTGFEWKSGANTTTKGVFIWSKPFLMETGRGKVVIFVLDSEGCNSVGQDTACIVQLSALSMLLSSYLIFNISTKLKQTDLDDLEKFLDLAQQTGEAIDLDPIQHVDFVVRDWFGSIDYGEKGGVKHLQETLQKVQKSNSTYPPFMEKILAKSRCYLLPFPGKSIALSSKGHVKDMDSDFRDALVDYCDVLLQTLPGCTRKDSKGFDVSGSQFFSQMKLFTETIEKYSLKIRTPHEMADALCNVNCAKKCLADFDEFLRQQKQSSDGVFKSVRVVPSTMRSLLEARAEKLSEEFVCAARGNATEREQETARLQDQLHRRIQTFCTMYGSSFRRGVIKCGVMAGAAALGTAGATVGAIVAGPVLAAGAVLSGTLEGAGIALGAGLGTGLGALLGSGVGAGVGAGVGQALRSQQSSSGARPGRPADSEALLKDAGRES
ncbi:RING finger protein 112-like isoform X2 [Stegostoma tigrinum]|uniref:RING finger protein 112-like isoform X2 n=1 Tax=Stegostoma tigrinum TaxID=3053191 RepID=UPI00286FD01E|nr:RING finger protein 112-like isoform X2 [Stegostoma tigrinum]